MSTDGAHAAVETLIADHVAASFQRSSRESGPAATTVRIRDRITDNFLHSPLETEQDNNPPEILQPGHSPPAALSSAHDDGEMQERAAKLSGLKDALAGLHGSDPRSSETRELERARERLILQRQQLFLKNEITEGLGRIEVWLLSLASLVPIFLKDVSILWALPLLAASIGRSWHLDRKCKRRLGKIAEIDRVIEGKISPA